MLNKVTITGIDDNVEYMDVLYLTKKYPFVEWGILFSEKRAGSPRYPSFKYMEGLIEYFDEEEKGVALSAHLCGSFSRETCQGNNRLFIQEYSLMNTFQRIQLNSIQEPLASINPAYYQYIFPNRLDLAQENCGAILFDKSGGRGIEIVDLTFPQENLYCGYAGGLNSSNVTKLLDKLNIYSPLYWIDVETGVRDEKNELDLNKVDKFLEICGKYI